MTDFYVGQKVVCVDMEGLKPDTVEIMPILSGVYTIREIEERPTAIGFRFVEIVNPRLQYRQGIIECLFDSRNFRPLEEQSKSIEIFRAIARGVSDGKPIVEDVGYDPLVEAAADWLAATDHLFSRGRPML